MKSFLHGKQPSILKVFWLIFIFIALVGNVNGEDRTASATGNWSNTATWGGAAVPTAVDAVTLNHDITVTVDINDAVCLLIVQEGVNGTATLIFNSGTQLTISGEFKPGNGTDKNFTLDMSLGGILKCAAIIPIINSTISFMPGLGTIELTATNTLPAIFSTFNNLTISGGTTILGANTTISGNLTIGAGTTLDVSSGNFGINLGGNWTNNGTFTQRTGTVTFNGKNNATISGSSTTAFSSLTIDKGTSTATIVDVNGTRPVSVSGSLALTQGLIKINSGGTLSYAGALTIPSSGGITVNGGTYAETGGGITNNGAFTVLTGSASIGTGSGQSITTSGTSGIFTFSGGAINIAGRLQNTTGTASISGGTLTLATVGNNTATASFDMSTGTNLSITGSPTIIFQNTNTGSGGDLVLPSGTGIKSITGGTFQFGNTSTLVNNVFKINSGVQIANLTVNNTNTPTVNLAADLVLSGNLINGGIFNVDTKSLTIGGELTQNGTMNINSDATNSGSLIVKGNSTGIISYNRYFAPTRWYIASAPVKVTSGFASNSSKINQVGSEYDLAWYKETNNDGWQYYNSFPDVLEAGMGYLISLNNPSNYSDGKIQFTGELNSNSDVSAGVTTSTNNGWNAVGNPYTSAIKIVGATGSGSFLDVNSAILNPDFAAIYVWNETASGYDGKTQYYKVIGNSGYVEGGVAFTGVTPATNNIQAGQGFIIHSNGASSNATFKKSMQVSDATLSLKSAETSWPGITLLAESKGQTRSTVVAFNENMTTGLDVSYDAGLLASDDFQVYTHLVDGNNPVDFAIQCLPDHQYSQLRVPVGIDLPEGGELVFKASGIILPDGLFAVIEDKVLGTKTALQTETDSYTVTLDQNTSGIGRFYLSMGGDMALSVAKAKLTNKYTASFVNDRIVVNGAVESETKAMLFDICGRKLGEYPLARTNRNEITVSGLDQKVYLLKIEGGNYSQVIKLLTIRY